MTVGPETEKTGGAPPRAGERRPVRSVHDLEVYALSFEAAMDVYRASTRFPPHERYSLTDQVRRSSRSVPGNIREGFAKRRYRSVFARHVTDALGSAEETRTWLDFARECRHLPPEDYERISQKYDRICAMLFRLLGKWT